MLTASASNSETINLPYGAPTFNESLPRAVAAVKFCDETYDYHFGDLGRAMFGRSPIDCYTGCEISNRLSRCLGYAAIKKGSGKDYGKMAGRIVLCSKLVERGTIAEVTTTILHEIGHLFAGISADHNKVWQDTCFALGLENAAQEAEGTSYKVRRNAWESTCKSERCGKTYTIARLTARRKRGGSICQCGEYLPAWKKVSKEI